MRPVAFLVSLALAVLAAAPTALAAPAAAVLTDADVPVIFKRSCAECAEDVYCEFSYPGAPAEHVACVAHTQYHERGLYRRYGETCSNNDQTTIRCSEAPEPDFDFASTYDFTGDYGTLDACEDACVNAGKTGTHYITYGGFYCQCRQGTCTTTTQNADTFELRLKVC